MADPSAFESREARIDREIQDGIDAIRGQATVALPARDAGLVQTYVRKIQGACDLDGARRDTENAIDLLSIAYNAVPQREGEIRTAITALMNRVIALQQKSQLTMQSAMHVATGITRQVQDVFPDWLDAREAGDRAGIAAFVTKDLAKLAASVEAKALEVRDQLLAIASSYGEVLADAAGASARGRAALSARLTDRQAAEEERSEADGKRERLDSLLGDLKAQVAAFEKKAREGEGRVGIAEQRAPAASAARVGVQALARAVPGIARAAGPVGLLASSLLGAAEAARETGEREEPDGQAPGGRDGAAGLRDMQLRLLDRIESYEEQRRGQSAELAEVAALLAARQTEQETVQLALRSLDVSLDALGRLKEVAEEVAALSAALADPGLGASVAAARGAAGAEALREGEAERLVAAVDGFFIRQAAMWSAVRIVSDDFGKLFAEGWSKLNKLSGTYVTGDRLSAYLKEASARLVAIAAEREAAADRRIASLRDHREKLTRNA